MTVDPHSTLDPANVPRRMVAIGGGTGLPNVLRGLRPYVERGTNRSLTAAVAVSDDGGSSGRLRKTIGLPPPGDVRNCLVALAEEEALLAGLFQYRYARFNELAGHPVGNLILAALTEQTGCFLKAIELSSRVLRTVGRILPATTENVVLEATLDDGSVVVGETRISRIDRPIRQIALRPRRVPAATGVVESILKADLIILGPGSLYTSVLSVVVVEGIAGALRKTRATVILVANLVSHPGEAAGLGLSDHLRVIEQHVGAQVVDAVLVHDGRFDREVLERYSREGAAPLQWPDRECHGVAVHKRDLLAAGSKCRHDPVATGGALVEAWAVINTNPTDELVLDARAMGDEKKR